MVEQNLLPLQSVGQPHECRSMFLRPRSQPRYVTTLKVQYAAAKPHNSIQAALLYAISSLTFVWIQSSDLESSSSVNLLVLGSRNSGKTTFIRNAIGKERTRTSTQVVIKDKYYRIQLIELLLDDVDFSSERRIEWPASVNGAPLPEVDGVFCLYDVADKESVADVPAALSMCFPHPPGHLHQPPLALPKLFQLNTVLTLM